MLRLAAAFLLFTAAIAQDYVCPMDRDVRSDKPGVCPRCGMALVLTVPDPIDYPIHLDVSPQPPKPGSPAEITIRIFDPVTGSPVTRLQTVHEKLCHLFIVSEDLGFFIHDHPELRRDGSFHLRTHFPQPGLYRVLADFYPEGATPQLAPATIIVPGPAVHHTAVAADLTPKITANMRVELATAPVQPIAGLRTRVSFRLEPADGLEKYLGAWAHMIIASDDIVDMIHTHPFIASGGPEVQFNVIFPRARTYRLWVQFQRRGVVNTASFTIPVAPLKL